MHANLIEQKFAKLESRCRAQMIGMFRELAELIGTLRKDVDRIAESMDKKAKAVGNAFATIEIMGMNVKALDKKAIDGTVQLERLATEASFCFLRFP